MKYLKNVLPACLFLLALCLLAACTSGFSESDIESTEPALADSATGDSEEILSSESDSEPTSESLSETVSETEAEVETVDYSTYTAHSGYTYLYQTATEGTPSQISGKHTIGTRIAVSSDCFLSALTFTCPGWGDNQGQMDVIFYRWDTDRTTTVAGEPVYTYTVKDVPDNSSVTVRLPEYAIGAGEWYYEFCNGSTETIGVWTSPGQPTDESDVVKTLQSFFNGREKNAYVQSYATHVRYEPGAEPPTPVDPNAYTQITEGKAHVIVLTGQSNAAGQSLLSYLKNTISAEDYTLYEKGFDNIFIDVHADNGNIYENVVTNGFVPVKLGQGSNAERFGIEIGLAAYLTKHYPGETFYIIKSGFSASGLAKHWQNGQNCHDMFTANMETSLTRIKNMGLEPEIFAFLWMQGETDACTIEDTDVYATLQDDLIIRMHERYAAYNAPGGFAFVDAAISEKACWGYASIVNMHKQTCDALSQNRYFIDTNIPDIDCRDENNDLAHYDSDDMIELGLLFGEAVGQVIENAKKVP